MKFHIGLKFASKDNALFAAEKKIKTPHQLPLSVVFLPRSAGIFRGERSLDKILEIACYAVKENVYEGWEDLVTGWVNIGMSMTSKVTIGSDDSDDSHDDLVNQDVLNGNFVVNTSMIG